MSVSVFLPMAGGKAKMYDLSKTGERIKELRVKNGFTQKAVAASLDIHIRTYRGIEKGKFMGRVDTLCMIAEYYSVSVEYLFGKDINEFENLLEMYYRLEPMQQEVMYKMTEAMINVLSGKKCD